MIIDYKERFNVLRNKINKFDPQGLIGVGAPENEYDSEIQKILTALQGEITPEELAEKIKDIFSKSFNKASGDEVKDDCYLKLAIEIARSY